MYQDNFLRELIVDNFAGGGGASTGIELALGHPVDIAVNHDGDAIAMHKVNHPFTTHYQEDVFAIEPEAVTGGRPVGLAWFSPDCKHFSRAKGGKPVEKKIRGLSWVILKWAMSAVAPRVIFMENVSEIQTWGPLKEDGKGNLRPDPEHVGETFKGFIAMLTTGIPAEHPALNEACEFLKIIPTSASAARLIKGLGYKVEYRELKACDYGAPTIRKRFYLIARNDGKPIVFPKPTHGDEKGLLPYRTAAECIDWNIPCPSIFERNKPLVENTLRRIARGLDKFTLRNSNPFIIEMNFQNAPQDPEKPMTTQTMVNHHYVVSPHLTKFQQNSVGQRIESPLDTVTAGATRFGAVLPSLVQYHTEQTKGEVRGQKVSEPILTVDGSPRYAVNACYISKYFSGEKQAGSPASEPMPTVTSIDHNAVVAVNVVHYYGGADHASKADAPLPTVTTLPRHYLVETHLCVLRRGTDCKPMGEPFPTVTTSAGHFAQVVTYLQKIDTAQDLGRWDDVRKLLNQYAGYNIAPDEILILEIGGVKHCISDIGMRMLKAEELKLAQGFPKDYVIDIENAIGKKYSEAKQIARLGNAVCPPVAKALILANCADMALIKKDIETMIALNEAFVKTVA